MRRLSRIISVSIVLMLDVFSVLSIIPAIIGAVGGIAAGAMAQKGARDVNSAQIALARENREFERDTAYHMMQNRHQWEVGDLRAAGLNPILSAHSAPSMGNVSADSPPLRNEWEDAAPIFANSAQGLVTNLLAMREQSNRDKATDAQVKREEAQAEWYKYQSNDLGPSTARELDTRSEKNKAETRRIEVLERETEKNIEYMESAIRTKDKEIENLIVQMENTKERSKTERTQQELNRVLAERARMEATTEMLRQIDQMVITYGHELDNQAKEYGMPERELRGEVAEVGKTALKGWEMLVDGLINFVKEDFSRFVAKEELKRMEKKVNELRNARETKERARILGEINDALMEMYGK